MQTAFAQEVKWTVIYPVSHCLTLPIAYQQQPDGTYLVKIKNIDLTDYNVAPAVEDLNDLSSITEAILEKSTQLCPESDAFTYIPIVTNDGDASCNENGNFFSDDYMEFVRFTADYVNQKGDQCENMIPLMKLQDQIEQLDQEELLKFKPSKNVGHMLLKILTDKETDTMINQFKACGGKKGSDKFISNMILLEAKKACIVPGMLSWAEAQKIADDLSKDYQNTNLLKLNRKQKQLSYDATMAFTNKILKNEVDSMLGPVFEDLNSKNQVVKTLSERKKGIFYRPDIEDAYFELGNNKNSESFINNLESKKRLDKFDDKDNLSDYVAYVFSVDAGIEIGKKAIPLFIESAFRDKLPEAWPESKKQKFIDEELTKLAMDKYDSCMKPRVQYSGYDPELNKDSGKKLSLKEKKAELDLLDHRLKSKESFCKENEEQCIEGNCDGSINMLQMDDSATDTEMIQGCVLQGITLSINPLLKGIVYDQRNEFAEDFDLNDEMAEYFSDYTWSALTNCANKNVKKALNLKGKVDILNTEGPLQKIDTDAYQDIMLKCADIAENKVAPKFVDQIIINNETIQKAFGDPKIIAQWEEIDKKYEKLLKEAKTDTERILIQEKWDQEVVNIRKLISNSEYHKIIHKHDNAIRDLKDEIEIIELDIKSEKNPIKLAQLIVEKENLERKIDAEKAAKVYALDNYPLPKTDDHLLHDVSHEIVGNSFNKCLAKQYELAQMGFDMLEPKHGLKQKNTMLCTPIVEMNASLLVVKKELDNMIAEDGLTDDNKIKEIISEYESCGQEAIKRAIDDVGSLTSNTPINTVEDSKHYLDINPGLMNCVSTVITKISHEVAGKQFKEEVAAQKGKIEGITYFANMEEDVKKVVSDCFSKGMKDLVNWSGFIAFNENDGLTTLQDKCSMEANQYVIPKLIVNETHIQMKSLIDDGFIKSSGQVGDVLFQAAREISNEYDLEKKNDLTGGEKIDHYFGEALKIHIEKGGSVETFTDELALKVETLAIKNVHNNLLDEIQKQTSGINERAKFSDLDKYFPASCLQDIYNKFMKDAPKDDDKEPMKLNDLASYMQTGLSYYESKDPAKFWDELKVLKNQCDNMDQYKTKEDFYASQFYQMIIKGQIYEEFKVEFKKGIMDSLVDQEASLTDPHKWIKQRYMNDMKTRMDDLLDRYLTASTFDRLIFNDNTVSDFATTNLENLLDKDQATKDKLSRMLIGKMFEKSGKDTFSDQFAQIQIEGNFGIDGVTEAVDEGKKGKSILWGAMSVGNKSGEKAAKQYFSKVENIKKAIDWETIPIGERKAMATSIFYDAVAESQVERSEKDLDPRVVWQAASGRSDRRFVDGSVIGVGYENYKDKIDKITDEVTNGYNNYENNVEAKAKAYAKELLKNNPSFKKDFTEKELADHIAKEVKKEHMSRNVTDRLLNIKRNKKTIKDKLSDDISDLGSDIFWGNTPAQKAAAQKRAFEKATNPWPIGPKL